MDDLWVKVSHGGFQQSFEGRGSCPNLQKLLHGDGQITWTFDFIPGSDQLPPRFASVEAHDDLGLVQTARMTRRRPPKTSECNGPATYTAGGLAEALGDLAFMSSTSYGPRWPDGPQVIADHPDEAIRHAIGLGGGGYVTDGGISATTIELADTEEFIGRRIVDAINAMTAQAGALSAPYIWQVQNGRFTWKLLDLSARYQVLCERGADVEAEDDTSGLYTDVLLIWGNNQVVTYPDTIVFGELPTQVTLVVNVGNEIGDITSAQRLAELLYGRLQMLELGWSCTITIPFETPIEQLGGGSIKPWRLPTAQVIRIPDLDPVGRWGPHAATLSDEQLIVDASWNGGDNTLTLRTGEFRRAEDQIRRIVMAGGGSRVQYALQTAGLYLPTRDADRTPLVGPALTTEAGTSGEPSAIGYGTPAYSKEHAVILPEVQPAMPYTVVIKGFSSDGSVLTPGTTPNVRADGLVKDLDYEIPFGKTTHWQMRSTVSSTITVQIYTQRRKSDGTYDVETSGANAGDPIRDRLLITASLSASKYNYEVYATEPVDQRPRVPALSEGVPVGPFNTTQNILIFIDGTPTAATDFSITVEGIRIDPRMPAGHTDFAE